MPSPLSFRPGKLSQTPSPSSTSSKQRLPPQHHDPHELKPQPIRLHKYLRKTQGPIQENIHSLILWDFREHPLTSALYTQEPVKLADSLLDQYATEPPVSSLTVTCEYPNPWSVKVSASALFVANMGGGVNASRNGMRNSLPGHLNPPASAVFPAHGRSSSTPPRYPPMQMPPVTPTMPTISLPSTPPTNRPRAVGVTIADVLVAIYDHLHKPADQLKLVAVQEKQRPRIMEAYDKRYKMTQGVSDGEFVLGSPTSPVPPAFPTYPAANVPLISPVTSTPTYTSTHSAGAEGVRLLDLLMKLTRFGGMEVDLDKKRTIILSVKQPH